MNKVDVVGSYWKIRHREFNDILSTDAVVVGRQGGGKTELVHAIIQAINAGHKEYKAINIYTRDYGEIHKLHTPYYADLLEELRDAEIINAVIDDALTSGHSIKRNKQIDIDYALVRHFFRSYLTGTDPYDIDLKYESRGATLNIFFVTQRYQLLNPFQREQPIFIAKAVDLNPTYDQRSYFQRTLGSNVIRWLRHNAFQVLIQKSKGDMCNFVIKPMGRSAIITEYSPNGHPTYHILSRFKREKWEKENGLIEPKTPPNAECENTVCGYKWNTKAMRPQCPKCKKFKIKILISS